MTEKWITPHHEHEHTHILYKRHAQVEGGENSLQRHQLAVALQDFCKGLSTFLLDGIVLEADEQLGKLSNYKNSKCYTGILKDHCVHKPKSMGIVLTLLIPGLDSFSEPLPETLHL